MTVAAVQRLAKSTNASGATSLSIGSGDGWVAPQPGNLIVVTASSDATLTINNSMTLGPSVIDGNGAYIWYKTATGSETTITVTPSVSDTVSMTACEYSGLTATPFDVQNSSTISGSLGTTTTSVSVTTTQPGDLVIAAALLHSTNAGAGIPTSPSWTNSFVNRLTTDTGTTSGGTTCAAFLAELVVGAAGAYSTSASWTNQCGDRQELVVAFKAQQVTEVGTTTYATANATTVTTGSFTPANNCLLVAYCSMGNGAGTASSLGQVTDSLGGTWKRLVGDASATGGVAEIWCRDIGTGASMTVTYDPGGSGASGLDIIVKQYTNALPSALQPGATATNGGTTAYTTSITTTTPNSLVVGAYGRATDAQSLTANASTTILGQVNGTSGDTAALFRATLNVGTPGATTLGFTNVAGGANRMALAEILFDPGTPTPSGPAQIISPPLLYMLLLAQSVVVDGGATVVPSAVTLVDADMVLTGVALDPVPQPVTITLTPATLTLTAIAVTPVPQPVTITLVDADMTLTAIAVTPVPQPVTVSLTLAILTLTGIAVTPTPQPVTISLTPAVMTLSAIAVTPTPGQVTTALTPAVMTLTAIATYPSSLVALTPATMTLTAIALTPIPQPVTINLTPAVMTLSAIALTATPGQVTTALTPAVMTLSAVSVTPVPQPVDIDLTPAVMTLGAVTLTATPGQVTTDLTPAVMTLTGNVFTFTGGSTINLVPAIMTLSGVAVDAEPGVVTTDLSPTTITLSGVALSPAPIGAVTLTPCVITLSGVAITPVPQPVIVALIPATLTLSAQPLGVPLQLTLTPATISLQSVALTPQPPGGVDIMRLFDSRVVFDTASILVTGVGLALQSTAEGAPERQCVVPGSEIAWDDCECGQLSVAVLRRYPSTNFPIEATIVQNCEDGIVIAQLKMSLQRCAPYPNEDGNPPTCQQLANAAMNQEEDVFTVRTAAQCILDSLMENNDVASFVIQNQVSVGPQGGCYGHDMDILVGFYVNCGCV